MRAPNFALALLAIAQLVLAIARVQNYDPASYQLPNNIGRPGAMKAQRPRYNPQVRTDLNDDEKHWFGSIGSNSRSGAQSAVDQTYRWFAPETQTGSSSSTAKATSPSLLTVDAGKGAQTALRESRTARSSRKQDPSKASPSGARPQQGVFRSTRTIRKPAGSDPTLLRFPGSHSILRRQDELKMVLSASKEQPSDPPAASPSAHFKRGESSGTVTGLTSMADPAAGDARQKRKASKRGLLDRKRSQTMGDIAQIAGYIVVGLVLAAVLSVVLFSCSQPLWWPWYAAHAGLVKAYSQLGAKRQVKSGAIQAPRSNVIRNEEPQLLEHQNSHVKPVATSTGRQSQPELANVPRAHGGPSARRGNQIDGLFGERKDGDDVVACSTV